ncbi:MAG TPA: nucleotidyltransferase [Clostridiales bacterium]|nr:nucleotidyltransferase [Clostridiales bacterium]
MQKTTLAIMAAGLGSRFGGIKQLEPIGPCGEIIMDYSIYDAIEAGFNKVVFIIRKDLQEDFKTIIGNRISKTVEVEYVFQELDNLPEGYSKPEGRTKPWGTGQAVLACKDAVKEPFVVINADDYYGKDAFVFLHKYLIENANNDFNYCMAGFVLGNTLSDNGTVTRGVCKVENNYLVDIVETPGIMDDGNKVIAENHRKDTFTIDRESVVSMNIWGFKPSLFESLEQGFADFLATNTDAKGEFLLPMHIDDLIKAQKATVKVLQSNDKWFGVTYKEDKEVVVNSIKRLIDEGKYPSKLFS